MTGAAIFIATYLLIKRIDRFLDLVEGGYFQ